MEVPAQAGGKTTTSQEGPTSSPGTYSTLSLTQTCPEHLGLAEWGIVWAPLRPSGQVA